jgi:hypothetical protein
MYAQITKSSVLAEGTFGETDVIKARYKNAVKNTMRMNGGVYTFVKGTAANGENVLVYKDGCLVRELYYVTDRTVIEFGVVNYDGKGK